MSRKKDTNTAADSETSQGFTDEERAAMRERARELRAEARAKKNRADGERDVLAKIAEMPAKRPVTSSPSTCPTPRSSCSRSAPSRPAHDVR